MDSAQTVKTKTVLKHVVKMQYQSMSGSFSSDIDGIIRLKED